MKSVLIIRHGAYGDMIHMSHLPRLLKENGYDYVGISTGFKGKQILSHNPFVDEIHFFEPFDRELTMDYIRGRWRAIGETYDEVINLNQSLETHTLPLEGQNLFYQHINLRRKRGEVNYYDVSTEWAGFPELKGKYRGEVYFTEKEETIVKNDLLRPGRFKDKFKVMINLAGSGPHKVFIQAREIAEYILKQYSDAVIFTTGGPEVAELDLTDLGQPVHSIVGKKPFRQALNMLKYMDLAIGCESGLMCGASMFDIPTIQLMTAASVTCHCKYATNDYSIQSPAKCSPCYKGPYKYYGCPQRNRLPICVYFNINKIKDNIEKVYNEKYILSKSS